MAPALATAAARETCIEALVNELVAGRLSDEEFDVRWGLALAAPTIAALNCLLDDLGDSPMLGSEGPVRVGTAAARPPVYRLRTGLVAGLVGLFGRRYR